ncbi:hypothetical protein LIA77_02969 [Sarocladium implicatum]|nr:hypothetical protein LIA77_02969 [Sarocladium implicatum]
MAPSLKFHSIRLDIKVNQPWHVVLYTDSQPDNYGGEFMVKRMTEWEDENGAVQQLPLRGPIIVIGRRRHFYFDNLVWTEPGKYVIEFYLCGANGAVFDTRSAIVTVHPE